MKFTKKLFDLIHSIGLIDRRIQSKGCTPKIESDLEKAISEIIRNRIPSISVSKLPGYKKIDRSKKFCFDCSAPITENNGCIIDYYSLKPVYLILRDGIYGKFWGCPNFPKCKHTQNLKQNKSRRKHYFYIDFYGNDHDYVPESDLF